MRSLFDEFSKLWPPSRQHAIGNLLRNIRVIRIPSDIGLVGQGEKESTIIVIDPEGETYNPMEFLLKGYEHVLYSSRKDFGAQLFASCLMSKRPDSFTENPIPYFFQGFAPAPEDANKETNFLRMFNSSEEKPFLISELGIFFKQERALRSIEDICLQAADEMISNALYNAPIGTKGDRLFQKVPREVDVVLPPGKKVKIFSCYSPQKVVIGCEDPFGSLQRQTILNRLVEIYSQKQSSPLMSTAGAGMGLKYMIENCANFYMFGENRKRSIVACTFLLEGRRKNIGQANHLHISIR